MATLTDVINQALDELGVGIITTLGTDGTPQDGFMNRNHLRLIKDVMMDLDWPSLRVRKVLDYVPGTLTLSSTAVAAGITATAGSSFFNERDVGAFLYEKGTGATGVSEITGYTSATVVTVKTTTAWADADGVLAQNKWYLQSVGVESELGYTYVQPSDLLVLRALDDPTARWSVEFNRILTGYDEAAAIYTLYDAAPDNWGQELLDVIVAQLAARAAWRLTKNAKLQTDMWTLYEQRMAAAEGIATKHQKRYDSYKLTTLKDVR